MMYCVPPQDRRSSRFWFSVSGTAAIEFAIVAPLLFAVVLGILSYGLYIGAVHSTAQLAADAARASVAGLNDSEREMIARRQVTVNAASYVVLDPAKLSVSAGTNALDATEFQVTVRYDARSLPIFGFGTLLPVPSQFITRSATVKQGGY
jgi:Flp pilus assembly protein TadG